MVVVVPVFVVVTVGSRSKNYLGPFRSIKFLGQNYVVRTNIVGTNVPNTPSHLIFVNLGCLPNFSFLGFVEAF